MKKKPKIVIVYASWTGNTEQVANILTGYFEKENQEVHIHECQQVNADIFLSADICVVATYTFGSEGDLPDEIYDFNEDLGRLDLTGKVFGVLGTGEAMYGYFCKAVDDFNSQFLSVGAVQGADVVKVELSANRQDIIKIEAFGRSLLKTYEEAKK